MADTADQVTASSVEDEEPRDEEAKDEKATDEEAPSITELLIQFGRDATVLIFLESELAAARNLPEVRRTARDLAGVLIVVLAFLTAFAFANVAALNGLKDVMSTSLAALLLCAAWLVIGAVVTLALMVHAGHVTGWRWWRVFRAGPEETLEDLEQARDTAEHAVHEDLGRLAPAVTVEIATASVSVAGDVAGDVLGAGGDILESADDAVEALAEELPAGSIVNQMWDVALAPGRLGVKVVTTVLKRGNSATEPD